MPAFQKVELDGFQIFVTPRGWRSLKFFDLLPYRYGSKPKFELIVRCLKEAPQSKKLTWFIKFAPGDITGDGIEIPPLQMDKNFRADIGGRLLGFTGDTILGIVDQMYPKTYHTLYSFRVIAIEDIIRDILMLVLGAIFTFLLFRLVN